MYTVSCKGPIGNWQSKNTSVEKRDLQPPRTWRQLPCLLLHKFQKLPRQEHTSASRCCWRIEPHLQTADGFVIFFQVDVLVFYNQKKSDMFFGWYSQGLCFLVRNYLMNKKLQWAGRSFCGGIFGPMLSQTLWNSVSSDPESGDVDKKNITFSKILCDIKGMDTHGFGHTWMEKKPVSNLKALDKSS